MEESQVRVEAEVKPENLTPSPHLNAELYRAHVPPSRHTYLDHILAHDDGTTLLCSSNLIGRNWDGSVCIYESPEKCFNRAENDLQCEKITMSNSISDACFLENSKQVMICDDRGMIGIGICDPWYGVSDPDAKKKNRWSLTSVTFAHSDIINAIRHISNSDNVVTASSDCTVKVWDTANMESIERLSPAHLDIVSDVSCHRTSPNLFLSCSLDGSFTLWDIATSTKKVKDYKYGLSGVRCLCWLTDNDFVIGNDDGTVSLYSIKSEGPLCTIDLGYPIHRFLYDEKSFRLAVCGDSTKISILKYSAESLQSLREDSLHEDYARGLLWCDDILYSCGWDGKVIKHFD